MSRILVVVIALGLGAAPLAAQVDSSADTGQLYRVLRTSGTSSEGWLGMGISCGGCSYDRDDNRPGRWTFSELPSVFSVDNDGPADHAGIRAGDTLVAIDGVSLTSRAGGEAFGSVRPGQSVTLRYRRDGQEQDARLTAVVRPYRAEAARLAAQLNRVYRQQQKVQAEQMRRQAYLLQRQMETQRRVLDAAMREMQRAQTQARLLDTGRIVALRRQLAQLDSAAARWRQADSTWVFSPPPAGLAPAAPLAATPPTAPLAAQPPEAPLAALAPSAPLAALAPGAPLAAWHREAGPLRYTGRIGDVIVEARGPGEVTTTEVSDSEVVVTSRDMSVRIAIRPRAATPRARTAPTPKPARPPRD